MASISKCKRKLGSYPVNSGGTGVYFPLCSDLPVRDDMRHHHMKLKWVLPPTSTEKHTSLILQFTGSLKCGRQGYQYWVSCFVTLNLPLFVPTLCVITCQMISKIDSGFRGPRRTATLQRHWKGSQEAEKKSSRSFTALASAFICLLTWL